MLCWDPTKRLKHDQKCQHLANAHLMFTTAKSLSKKLIHRIHHGSFLNQKLDNSPMTSCSCVPQWSLTKEVQTVDTAPMGNQQTHHVLGILGQDMVICQDFKLCLCDIHLGMRCCVRSELHVEKFTTFVNDLFAMLNMCLKR